MEHIWSKTVRGFKSLVQCTLISAELFNKNGLANHAAASAYGFLFSAVPAMIIVSFLVSQVLQSSQETAAALIGQMGLLSRAFDIHQLTHTLLSVSKPGIAGIAGIAGLLWAARIFALSLQRGLGVIFFDTDKIKPVRKMMTSVVLEAAIILFTFIIAFSSRMPGILTMLIPLIAGALFIFAGYTFVPASAPKLKAAITGTIFCTGSFVLISFLAHIIFNPERYNILYGTLGNLLILLVNVYFLFIFFFLGAELTFIVHSFDMLLLARFLNISSEAEKNTFTNRWFASTNGALKKYVRSYEKEKVIIEEAEESYEIYFILSGSAGVYLENNMVELIEQGSFFGEMGHVLSKGRSATIKAHTDLEALVIPPDLFRDVLRHSSDADQKMIAVLSERLKNTNEKLTGAGIRN